MDKYGAAFELLRSLVEGRSPEEITDEQLLVNLSFSLSEKFFKTIESDPDWIAGKAKAESLAKAQQAQTQKAAVPLTPKPEPKK